MEVLITKRTFLLGLIILAVMSSLVASNPRMEAVQLQHGSYLEITWNIESAPYTVVIKQFDANNQLVGTAICVGVMNNGKFIATPSATTIFGAWTPPLSEYSILVQTKELEMGKIPPSN